MIPFDSDVSRETLDRLAHFEMLVQKWNLAINLISKSSMPDLWHRHIWDSAQIYDLSRGRHNWLDIGSGGGLPGLVVAIIALERDPDRQVTMIESDTRKATFLRTVIRELNLRAEVIVNRIERVDPIGSSVLSARALADLSLLLEYAEKHLEPSGHALFFKGETWEKEVDDARNQWSFDLVAHKSRSNAKAAILEVKDIQRV